MAPRKEEGKEEGEAAPCAELDAVSPGDCVSGGKEDGEGQAAQRPGERREGDATAGGDGGDTQGGDRRSQKLL